MLPRANATDIATFTQFEWEIVPNAGEYELEIQDVDEIAIRNITTTETRYRLQTNENLTSGEIQYQYRVKAKTNGAWGEWTNTRNFTTLKSETDWYNGNPEGHFNNAIAYSNSGYNYVGGTGSYLSYVSGVNTGLRWQCTEYCNRTFYQVYGLSLLGYGFSGNAKTFFANAATAGLLSYPTGSTMLPEVGDMLCWSSSKYGHVAIVMEVDYSNMKIKVAQQNGTSHNGTYIGKELNITQVGNGYKIVYVGGQNGYKGIIRANPHISYPQNNEEIATTTPTFQWEEMPSNSFTIYIKEKGGDGCYNLIHTGSGHGHSYYLPEEHQLTSGKEYLYRLVNHLPSGSVSNEIRFFSVSSSKSGASSEVLPTRLLVNASDISNSPISNVRVFTENNGEWKDRNLTNNNGNLQFSTFDEFSASNVLQATCNGFQTLNHEITDEELTSGVINITLETDASNNFVINPNIQVWDNATANTAPFFTNPNAKLKITAVNHNSYTLIINGTQDENDPNNNISYDASQEIIDYEYHEGVNNIVVFFANETDTMYYSKQITYIPEAGLEDTTYTVTVISNANVIDTKILIDGLFVKTIESSNEEIIVPNGTRRFTFIKDGYNGYFETTNSEQTINLTMTPVGIDEEPQVDTDFIVFPNPTSNNVNIKLSKSVSIDSRISIYNVLGEKLVTTVINSGETQTTIDVSSFAKGVYFVEVLQGQLKQTQKFVVE